MSVTGQQLIAMFETQLGHPLSGDYDMLNGYNHPWAYFCEAGVESTGRQCGLDVTPRGSATGAGLTAALAGILRKDEPPHGSVLVFGPAFFWPYGHTGFWNADRQQLLGTLTDGTGVGYTTWGPGTTGYAGWYELPGSTTGHAEPEPDPPPANFFVQPSNPYQIEGEPPIGIGGGMLRYYNSVAIGIDPMVVLGYALAREETGTVVGSDGVSREQTIQRFERGTLLFTEGEPFPWDVTMALKSQTITVK
jgi:hypothetical protein